MLHRQPFLACNEYMPVCRPLSLLSGTACHINPTLDKQHDSHTKKTA